MLMWLMSEAKGVERSLEGFARRLLEINFAAIFTTSLVSHANILMGHSLRSYAVIYKCILPSPFQPGIY